MRYIVDKALNQTTKMNHKLGCACVRCSHSHTQLLTHTHSCSHTAAHTKLLVRKKALSTLRPRAHLVQDLRDVEVTQRAEQHVALNL